MASAASSCATRAGTLRLLWLWNLLSTAAVGRSLLGLAQPRERGSWSSRRQCDPRGLLTVAAFPKGLSNAAGVNSSCTAVSPSPPLYPWAERLRQLCPWAGSTRPALRGPGEPSRVRMQPCPAAVRRASGKSEPLGWGRQPGRRSGKLRQPQERSSASSRSRPGR